MLNRVVTNIQGEKVYITIDGDCFDDIAFVYYGKHGENTELLMQANPDALIFAPVFPAGVRIILPAIPQREQPRAFKSLWD